MVILIAGEKIKTDFYENMMPEVVNRAQELETEKESPIDSNNDQSPPLTLKKPTKAASKKIQRIFHFK